MRTFRLLQGSTGRRALAIAVLCTLLACANAGELSHADGMDSLRERMRRIDALVFERMLTPLEVDRERMRRADEIAELAGDLAAAAEALAISGNDAFPDDARRALFIDNARRLGAEASVLGQLAAERRLAEVSARLERLGHACAACHAGFRGSDIPNR